jgi:alkylated DNA repair dioxygenase AlkB
MDFRNKKTLQKIKVLLDRRSLLVMKGSARYDWTHGIAKGDKDIIEGKEYVRGRRISLTWRIMRQDYLQKQRDKNS